MKFSLEAWNEDDYNNFLKELKSSAEPNTAENFIMGVRTPKMRALGKEIAKGSAYGFLKLAKDNSYEEIFIQGVVIGQIKTESFDEFITNVNGYIGKIDSWALCDGFCTGLKEVKKYKSEFLPSIAEYTQAENPWIIRVGLVLLLTYYIDDKYVDEALKLCDNVSNDEYYVSMARAWLAAEALAKCPDRGMAYIHSNSLDKVTFNRAVQKCRESRRIDGKTKDYLKTLKKD